VILKRPGAFAPGRFRMRARGGSERLAQDIAKRMHGRDGDAAA